MPRDQEEIIRDFFIKYIIGISEIDVEENDEKKSIEIHKKVYSKQELDFLKSIKEINNDNKLKFIIERCNLSKETIVLIEEIVLKHFIYKGVNIGRGIDKKIENERKFLSSNTKNTKIFIKRVMMKIIEKIFSESN